MIPLDDAAVRDRSRAVALLGRPGLAEPPSLLVDYKGGPWEERVESEELLVGEPVSMPK